MLNTQLQEKMIQNCQEFFSSWQPFISFLNNFDKPYFYFFLVIIIWFLAKQKTGYRLFFLLVFSTYVNAILKEYLQLPRPYELAWVKVYGYGMPSGGAQSALLIALFGIKEVKNKFFTLFCIFYFLLISFSRVILGVHYFTDVLGGWLVGSLCYLIYIKTYLPNEEIFFPLKNYKIFIRNIVFLLTPALIFQNQSVVKLSVISISMLFGSFCFPLKNWDNKGIKEKLVLVLPVVLLIGFGLFMITKSIYKDNFYFNISQNLISGFSVFFFINLLKK